MTPRRELEVLWHVTNLSQQKWGNLWVQYFQQDAVNKSTNVRGNHTGTGYRPQPPTKTELKTWSYEMWKRCDKILNPK